MSTSIRKLATAGLVSLILGLATLPTFASELAKPGGKVILTVTGNIETTNAGDRAEFDRAMLEALGESEIKLETPWTDGQQHFVGVLGSRILDAVGASGETIIARAINDYQVKIPVSDLRKYPVLFALQQNGKYMRVRGKGPIWIIYPRETYPELDNDIVTDRWVWQLKEIEIR